jgi:hypothetical protein
MYTDGNIIEADQEVFPPGSNTRYLLIYQPFLFNLTITGGSNNLLPNKGHQGFFSDLNRGAFRHSF